MAGIQSFSNSLKIAGMELKSMQPSLVQSFGGKKFDIITKNGQKGVYNIINHGNGFTQEVRVGNKLVRRFTEKNNAISQPIHCEYGQTRYIPQRKSYTEIKELGDRKKTIYASVDISTPLNPVNQTLANGSIRTTKVPMANEFHSEALVSGSNLVVPTDILIGGNGEYLPIAARNEPYFANQVRKGSLFNRYA